MRHCTDEEIAVHAQRTLLDIAIDLKGFTRDSRPGIFARGCAPVHINFLGYPGTMGAPYIDYLIADRFVVPEDEREHYSERILYTPGAYQPNDRTKRISERVFTRRELGLPENGFVFCSFNNNYKVIPEVFDTWTQILLQTPGSVLWLYKDNDVAKDNLIEEAAARNVDPNRIIFAEKMPLSEHLSRHRLADLFLDTFPCSAHTTASDALWSGLPIITMCGRSFASRVAGSLLFHVGLSELITYDRASYERLALELAHDPERLKKIKEKLTIAVKSSELFDTRAYAKNLESLFEGLVVGQH
jgi:predicted O-linked N-acetylglucosamine transferase (SPINDLY family)